MHKTELLMTYSVPQTQIQKNPKALHCIHGVGSYNLLVEVSSVQFIQHCMNTGTSDEPGIKKDDNSYFKSHFSDK